MGIDWSLEMPCPVRAALGGGKALVALVKRRHQAEAAIAIDGVVGGETPPAEIRLRTVVQMPDGRSERETTARELLQEAEPLRTLEGHCAGCPVNVAERAFGCFGSISYPIRRGTETAMLGLLSGDVDSTAVRILGSTLADFELDGKRAGSLRGLGGRFFEGEAAAKREWRGRWSAREVDFDQIFELMFAGGEIAPAHGFVLCLILGVLDARTDPREIVGLMHDSGRKRELLMKAEVPLAGSAGQEGQFAGFLEAVRRGAAFEVALAVDT